MKIKFIYCILTTLVLAACSDQLSDMPENLSQESMECGIRYITTGMSHTGATTRADNYCWDDWNENAIFSIDVLLLDGEDKILAFYHKDSDTELSNNCNTENSFAQYSQLPKEFMQNFKNASKIVMVANYPDELKKTDILGKDFGDIYKSHTMSCHDDYQDYFVMAGEEKIEADNFSLTKDLTVSLERLAVKVRVALRYPSGNYISASDFYSQLYHYALKSDFSTPIDFPPLNSGKLDGSEIHTATVELYPEGYSSFTTYPDDIEEEHNMIRDNGHVYYCYPSDWVDYGQFSNSCPRNGKTGHTDSDHTNGKRYSISNYDDKAPIDTDREMFLIVKAKYEGKDYFYKVPTNYRFYLKNDQLCYSKEEIKEVMSLYRAERNHFYDIVATVDRAGAASPAEAINPAFTLEVAPLTADSPLDYIY